MKGILIFLCLASIQTSVRSQIFLFSDKFKWEEAALFYAKRTIPEDRYFEDFEILNRPLDNERDTISYKKFNRYMQLEYSVKTNLVGRLYYVGEAFYPDTISLYVDYGFDTEFSVRHTFFYLEEPTDTVLSYYDELKGMTISKFKKGIKGTYNIETNVKLLDNRSTIVINYYDMNDEWRLITTRRYKYENFYFHFLPKESR